MGMRRLLLLKGKNASKAAAEEVIHLSKTLSTHTRLQSLEEYMGVHPSPLLDQEVDGQLFNSCYEKALHHLDKTPIDLSHYPAFQKLVEEVFHSKTLPVEERDGSPITISEMRARLAEQSKKPLSLHEVNSLINNIELLRALPGLTKTGIQELNKLRKELIKIKDKLSKKPNSSPVQKDTAQAPHTVSDTSEDTVMEEEP